MSIRLGFDGLTRAELLAVARGGQMIVLADEVVLRLTAQRAAIEEMVQSGVAVYGVSTGFGSLATTFVAPDQRRALQRALIRSHAAGVGPEVEVEVVRAMMVSRLTTLCSGVTGVQPSTALAYAAMLNAHITPVVYEYGSLGCSGDLAPLAHVALALMGEGDVILRDATRTSAAHALEAAGLEPVQLAEKEGLALLNGTDGMLGQLIMALEDGENLMAVADVSASLSIQALRGTDRVFIDELQALRPQVGQRKSAANLLALLADSHIVSSHLGDTTQVQDAYSLRCAPQVHGAARDTFTHASTVADIELASAIDNPSILPDGTLSSNGNFHGAPVAYVLDFLAIAVADVASMAERRTDRLLDVHRNYGLPPFLAHQAGVDSGLMIAQYTQAAMVSEMKRLAAPASVDSIPSSAMQEDHVSMGWHAARKLRRSLSAFADVLAIELVASSRAMALRAPLRASPAGAAVADLVNSVTGGPGPDRWLSPELSAVGELVRSGEILATVRQHLDIR
ncbi:MAG: histidine ammonia-lyase [Acidimicrobiaceae bacterium]|nr:histidine ammonia-lyase [Acidimicrobiaceae bacterium]